MKKTTTIKKVKQPKYKNKNDTQDVSKAKNILFWVTVSVPIFLLGLILTSKLINVPFWDQWELVTIFKKADMHTLGFSDFFAQHNEHRVLFPRLIMYSLAKLSSWDVRWESWTSLVIATGTFVLLVKMLRKSIQNYWLQLFGASLISVIFFSPIQWENWLWGWQVAWFLNVFTLAAAVYVLVYWSNKSAPLKIALATALAAVGTYSLASGFFIWLVCLPIIYFNKDLKKLMPYWIGAAIMVVGLNYIGYVDPGGQTSKSLFIQDPKGYVAYVVIYIARPITYDFLQAYRIGAVYLLSLVAGLYAMYKYHKELFLKMLPWIVFASYAVLAALSTGVSRLGLGLEQAYSNRYITLSILLLIPVIVLLLKLIELHVFKKKIETKDRIIRTFAATALGLICVLTVVNYYRGMQQTQEQHNHLVKVYNCAHSATSVEDPCLVKLYPNAPVVWDRLQYIRQTHRGGL